MSANDFLSTCTLPTCDGSPWGGAVADEPAAGDRYGARAYRLAPFELGGTACRTRHEHGDLSECSGRAVADGKLAWEMRSAREVQRHNLPGPLDLGGGLSIAGANLPATHLSGDVYDFVRVGSRLYFLLCDVSGKGLGSALVATQLGRVFRLGARRGWSLAALDRELHETATEADGSEKFATGILGVLDVDARRLRLLAAGHDAPTVSGAVDARPVTDSTGMVHCWGSRLDTRIPPPVVTLWFGPGQSLLCYTDGVSDRWDSDAAGGKRFGRSRVLAAHAAFAGDSAAALCRQLLAEALRFGRSPAAPRDDMTVLAVHWRG